MHYIYCLLQEYHGIPVHNQLDSRIFLFLISSGIMEIKFKLFSHVTLASSCLIRYDKRGSHCCSMRTMCVCVVMDITICRNLLELINININIMYDNVIIKGKKKPINTHSYDRYITRRSCWLIKTRRKQKLVFERRKISKKA